MNPLKPIIFNSRTKIVVRWTTDMKAPIESLYTGKGVVMGIKRASCFEDELSKQIGNVDRIVTYTVKGEPTCSEELACEAEYFDHVAWHKRTKKTFYPMYGKWIAMSLQIANLMAEGNDLIQVKECLENEEYLENIGASELKAQELQKEINRLISIYN
jgi:hypothetical protein